jgi:PKD repeat protein
VNAVRSNSSPASRLARLTPAIVLVVAACDDVLTLPQPNFMEVPPGTEIFVGAGDVASCAVETDEATAAILDTLSGTVYTTGDNAYESGTTEEFANCYDPTWGRHRDRTRPVPGNHEYNTPGATPYFEYFGEAAGTAGQGYYSYDLGSWHIIALNSEIGIWAGSPQYRWLEDDLAASPAECALAYWHRPLFSSGLFGGTVRMRTMYELLYQNGVDVALTGHSHLYERFAPQSPYADLDPAYGIRQFIVGTGGSGLSELASTLAPNSEVLDNNTFGVLMLHLSDGGYDWEFIPAAGGSFTDQGSDTCHGVPPENQAPIADAGPDQTAWLENGTEIASGETAPVTLGTGSHTITLRVTDDAAANASDDVIITVQAPGANESPSASFSFTCTDLTCDFTDQSTDDSTITSWSWEFGDGNSSTAQNPTHGYTAGGTYSVTLTITDDGGLTDQQSQPVTVSAANQAPTASFSFACTDLTCDFTDQSTDDGTIASWSWDFGDGNSSTAQNPSHGYAAGGTYSVTLTVTDDGGLTDQQGQDVTVSGDAPAITLTTETARWGSTTRVVLEWSGASATVDVLRSGTVIRSLSLEFYVDRSPGTGTVVYQVCEQSSSVCSNTVTVEL